MYVGVNADFIMTLLPQKEQLVPRYLTEGIDQEGFEERFIDNFIGEKTVILHVES